MVSNALDEASPPKPRDKECTFALVGNPNSGKTTLFNHLTGLRQKVANYPGVTVEKKVGSCYSQHGRKMHIVDLPGAYSLSAHSPDEAILQKVLMGHIHGIPRPDKVICVVDATHLERSLFLVAQIVELGFPTILVLNMMDLAQRQGLFIDTGRIEKELGVTVVTTQAHKKEGLLALRLAMSRTHLPQPNPHFDLPKKIAEAVLSLQASLIEKKGQNLTLARGQAFMLLTEGTPSPSPGDDPEITKNVQHWQQQLYRELPNWRSLIIEARYKRIDKLYNEAVFQKSTLKREITEHLDSVFLHKYFGWLAFFTIMFALFWSIFSLSTYPMAAIEFLFAKLGNATAAILPQGPLQSLVTDGIISGVGSVIVFLPQIIMLFFFIGILESSGYLPRAVFLVDKVMRRVGLQGKSFIPLLSSYACAVPGIMATRTLASRQERFATIMVAPWMSCSARLPVYLLMIATLFPNREASPFLKASFLLAAYALGTFFALAIAWFFRKTLLRGKTLGSVMELPRYRIPSWKNISIEMLNRSSLFLKRAGTLILAFSIILWFLMAFPQSPSPSENPSPSPAESYISTIGHALEPIIQPLGFDWKIGVGLLSSFAARELFVSTMAIIHNVENDFGDETSLAAALQNQTWPDGSPVFSTITCYSLIVFFIFAMQCVSTLAIVKRETNSWRWPLFQFTYMTSFAYAFSFLVYQGGRLIGF